MSTRPYRERFFLYPDPIRAPAVPNRYVSKSNPKIQGLALVVAAFLMEWIGFIRRMVWRNAGFGSLPSIREHLVDTEPLFDPTVFPLEDSHPTVPEESKLHTQNSLNTDIAIPQPRGRYSVADYRRLYLSGEITPSDVVQAILPFIRRDTSPPGKHSLAWFDVNVDLVLRAAEESTLRYKENRSRGPLDGVPTAVKDEYDMEGYRTNLGSVNDYTGKGIQGSTIDTWCVQKLQEAGAIILGKLSMHEFGMDTSGNNITYGTPRNPYNQQYYTGGSSSGCAYAVATGLIPVAMGSDGGGSVRIPSSFCSVFGLKPTHGRLSFFPNQNHSKTCGVNGPIAADIQSLAALYAVVSAPDPVSLFPAPSSQNHGITDFSRPRVIGVPNDWFQRATPAMQTLCQDMIDRLVERKHYKVVPIEIPFLQEGQIAHALTILTDAATLLPDTRRLSPANRILLALGRSTRSTDYLLAQKLRRVLMQHLAWLWQKHPGMVIVTPTTACPGWPIRSTSELKYGISDGDQTLATMEYVWMGNFCGVPSINIPAGYVIPEGQKGAGEVAGADTQGKVPVGFMATGEWASEDGLMQFGRDAEEIGMERSGRPPTWIDIVEIARHGQKG